MSSQIIIQLIANENILMRLAADYQQQKNKKPEKQSSGQNRKVVKLGKGLPLQQKRKRGISRSEDNSRIERMSLGHREVSREKLAEMHRQEEKMHQTQYPQTQKPQQKVVTTACYGNRDRRPENYVTQHLLVSSPTQFNRNEKPTSPPMLTVKSQRQFFPQPQQSFQNVSKLSAEHLPREVYVPTRVIPQSLRSPSLDQQNLVRVNWQISQQKANFNQYQNRIIPQIHPNHPKDGFSRVSVRSGGKISEGAAQIKPLSPEPQKVILIHQNNPYQQISPQQTQKMISSRDDPYNLYNSKMTRRNGDPSPGRIREEELKQTKKQLRGVPQCKQLSNSLSNNSMDSSRNRSKKFTSLWDAQKTESRVSMRESQDFKVQQSEVMIDYFNPNESRLKKL